MNAIAPPPHFEPLPSISRARIPPPLFFDNLSNIVSTPSPSTVDKNAQYTTPSGSNYHYASSGFEDDSNANTPDSSHAQNYSVVPRSHSDTVSHGTTYGRDATTVTTSRYVSDSPSPTGELHPHPFSAPHHQDHFPLSASSFPPEMVNSAINFTDRYLRGSDKYPHSQPHPLDQRRMSEPAIFGSSSAAASYTSPPGLHSPRYHQLQHQYSSSSYTSPRSYSSYTPFQRGLSSSSLRGPHHSAWKQEDDLSFGHVLDEPISPLNPTFTGGADSPSMGIPSMPYGSLPDDPYGPSPPGTGTSTSSNPPGNIHSSHPGGGPAGSSNKQYSFVSLPGNAVKKRPRRRYDEIERLYQCSWPDCTKAYGTLNHLNAHVTMQKHGSKRSPNEFKELRKQWRKAKKEEADSRALTGPGIRPSQLHMRHDSLPDAELHHYNSQIQSSHSHHRVQIGMPSSLPVSALPDARYATSASYDDLQYSTSDEFDSHSHPYVRRQQPRFSIGSWHGSSSRSNPVYTSSQQQQYQHHNTGLSSSSSSHVTINRLPPDSTLLTPLPGYELPSVLSNTMHAQGEMEVYNGSYDDVYEEDGRPGSGHSNLSAYADARMRRNVYGEDIRPRSSHSQQFRGPPEQDY